MSKHFTIMAGTIAALLLAAGLIYAGPWFKIEPIWISLGVILLPIAVFLIRKYPALPLVALLFVGGYKTQAAEGISLLDPTLIVAALLALATGWELVLICIGRGSLREVFLGQGGGVLAFLCFFCVLAISYLYTPSPVSGADKLMRFAVFDMLVFFAPFFLLKNEPDFRRLAWLVGAFAIPLAIRLIMGITNPTEQQLLGNADVTQIGIAQSIGISALIMLYYRLPGRFGRLFAFTALPVLAVGLMASIARGPILTLLIVVVIMTVLLPGQGIVSRKTLIAGVLVLAMVMGASLMWLGRLPISQNRGPGKMAELSALAHGTLDAGGTTSIRLGFYKSTIVAFITNPFTGVGLAGWPAFYGDRTIPYPHNFVLEVAAEQGLPGLAALVALLGGALLALSRLRKSKNEFTFVLPVFLFCILSNLVSNGIENRVMFFWISVTFVAARMAKQKERQPLVSPGAPAYFEAPGLLRGPQTQRVRMAGLK
jgi:O-antigen ligase